MRRFALVLLVACSSNAAKTEPPPSATPRETESGPPPADPSAGSGSSTGSAVPPSGNAKLGEPCGVDGSCGQGTCVSYYGIAGPRGPEFKSCEIRCNDKTPCPSGLTCRTIADGPGAVCR